jgi:hypothetical protein
LKGLPCSHLVRDQGSPAPFERKFDPLHLEGKRGCLLVVLICRTLSYFVVLCRTILSYYLVGF